MIGNDGTNHAIFGFRFDFKGFFDVLLSIFFSLMRLRFLSNINCWVLLMSILLLKMLRNLQKLDYMISQPSL